jgi:deoxyribonuclease-4
MELGYHVSASGGLYKAFIEAEALECTAIQIFVGSPQTWAAPNPPEKDIERFIATRKASKVKKVLVHAAYLPNPSSPKATLRNLSLKKLKDEAKVAYAIGADGYNFHCGSNADGTEQGIANAIDTLNRLAELTEEKWPVRLIIENDAGAGNRIGDTIEEVAQIWKGLNNPKRFGVCLDTCHLFVSGIDVSTKKAVDDLVNKFDKLIGLKNLHFIHTNDAKFGLGSKKDRHANIGAGEIGLEGFKALLNHPKLQDKAFILETPRSGDLKVDIKDIRTLKKLIK